MSPSRLALICLLGIALGGCSGGGAKSTTSTPVPTASGGKLARDVAWPTYGGSSSRSGVAQGAPASPKLRRLFARAVDGDVYAQPLIAGGRIYVATENNSVYSFTGGGRLVWRRHLGAPVAGGDLPCGNISQSGITGTPVIAGGRLYAVAFLGASHTHVLFGLSLANGRVSVRANVDPPNDPLVEQQRGALLAANGRVYVPYGGLFGDCGPFHGYVVGVEQRGGGRIVYANPASEAGIWAPAGISEQAGTLLVATGNGGGAPFQYQSAVIRLSAALRRVGLWAPRNYQQLSASDTDEGSLAPLPVTGGRVFQIGKDGVGHLLPHALGGVGGQGFAAPVCGGGAFGAAAFRSPFVIVSCGGSLYGLRLEGSRFSVAWKSDAGGLVPVIAGDNLFALTSDGTLDQVRLADGSVAASTSVGHEATSFPAPAAAGRTLVAPAGRQIVVFSL